MRTIIRKYLKKNDVWNLKCILRGVTKNHTKEEISKLLIPFGIFSSDSLESYLAMGEVESILKNVKLFSRMDMAEGIRYFKNHNSLGMIENLLDKKYYEEMLELSIQLPKEAGDFRDILLYEIDVKNIINLLDNHFIPQFLVFIENVFITFFLHRLESPIRMDVFFQTYPEHMQFEQKCLINIDGCLKKFLMPNPGEPDQNRKCRSRKHERTKPRKRKILI